MIDAILGHGYREVRMNRQCMRFLLNYSVERTSAWIFLVAMLVLAFRLTGSAAVVASVLLVQVLGRAIVTFLVPQERQFGSVLVSVSVILRVGAFASLILVESRSDMWWALAVVGLISVTSGITESAQATMVPALGPRRQMPSINRLIGRCEQLSAAIGPALAAAILIVADERAAFAVAALLSYVSLIIVRRFGTVLEHAPDVAGWENPFAPAAWSIPSNLRVVVTGLAAIAALGMIVRVALIEVVVDHLGHASGYYALLIAIVGVGALLGPLPVDRILGHFSAALVIAGSVIALSFAAIVVGVGGPFYILAPAMLASGLVIVTVDLTAAVAIRMAVPERVSAAVTRSLIRMMLAAQIAGLIAILLLASTWSVPVAVVAVSLICVGAIGVHFVQAGGMQSVARVAVAKSGKSARGS